MGRKRSERGVREIFMPVNEKGFSKCLVCEFDVHGSHLGNLTKHLRHKHVDLYHQIIDADVSIQPPRKKKKVTVEYDVQRLLDAWVDLVVKEGKPFSTLDSKALRTIVKPLFDALELNLLSSDNVTEEIRKRSQEKKDQLRQLLAGRMISLKIDAASRHNRRVVCINAQFIMNGQIVVKTLSMGEMNRSHTGAHIKQYVVSVLDRYNINYEQVYSITQDNGKNFICAANMMEYLDLNLEGEFENEEEEEYDVGNNVGDDDEWEDENPSDDNHDESDVYDESEDQEDEDEIEDNWIDLDDFILNCVQVIRCAAHTLNLAVEDTLANTNLKKVINKFRKLAIYLRTPTNIDKLKTAKLTMPKTDTKTRWNSKYDMVVSVMRLKTFCASEKITMLTASDWKKGEIFLETFKPSKTASKQLQNQQLSLGDFFKIWLDLTLRVRQLSKRSSNSIYASELDKNLMAREDWLFKDNPTLAAALYLDPRFRRIFDRIKPKYFSVTQAQQHLLALYKQIKKIEKKYRDDIATSATPSSTVQLTSSSSSITPQSQNEDSVNEDILKNYINGLYEDQSDDNIEDATEDEDSIIAFATICQYNDKTPLDINLLDYWHNKRFSNPLLFKLASVLHAVPATQVSVERCFSVLRFILSDYRTRMRPDTLEDLMILRLNCDE